MVTVDFIRLKVASGSRVLDIGCGSGRHTAAAMALPIELATGVDTRIEDLRSAEDRLNLHHKLGATAGGSWAFACADALRLPFRAGAFEVVICAEVLEHIPDHERAVNEALRVLRPGGTLVVSVPRYWPEKLCWRLSPDYGGADGGHIRIYRPGALVDLLTANGLKITGRHFAHSLHSPYWWLKCLVGIEKENALPVQLYHRFLTWVMMKKPRAVCFLERLLDPLMGKSVVVYVRKNG